MADAAWIAAKLAFDGIYVHAATLSKDKYLVVETDDGYEVYFTDPDDVDAFKSGAFT
jgi:hypothetical protein